MMVDNDVVWMLIPRDGELARCFYAVDNDAWNMISMRMTLLRSFAGMIEKSVWD
jgi:hypothetical protein